VTAGSGGNIAGCDCGAEGGVGGISYGDTNSAAGSNLFPGNAADPQNTNAAGTGGRGNDGNTFAGQSGFPGFVVLAWQ
jgi:hypothetical protein